MEEKSAGGAARGKEEERKAGRWGLYPLRRLVTPFESVRLLPPGGYSQVGVGERERKLALALALAVLGKVVYVSASGSGCCCASARALRRRVALSSLSRGRGLLRRELAWLRVVKGLE